MAKTDPVVWHGPEELRPHLVPIDSVQPHPDNFRQGDVGAMTESLQEFGQYRLAHVREQDGYLAIGSHLWKAAKAMGWTHIAALMRDLSEAQARKLRVADNRMADLGTYDQHAMAEQLQLMAMAGEVTPGIGFDLDDVDDLLAEVNRTPVLPPSGTDAPIVPEGDEATRRQDRAQGQPGYRDVKLMVPQAEWQWFSEAVQALREAYDVDGVTAVVMRAVANEHARVKESAE